MQFLQVAVITGVVDAERSFPIEPAAWTQHQFPVQAKSRVRMNTSTPLGYDPLTLRLQEGRNALADVDCSGMCLE